MAALSIYGEPCKGTHEGMYSEFTLDAWGDKNGGSKTSAKLSLRSQCTYNQEVALIG